MKKSIISLCILLALLIVLAGLSALSPDKVVAPVVERPTDKPIMVTSPSSGQKITSPLRISGRARGQWYFEASFPVVLTDWDGKIIAEGIATAEGEWMTTEFVPFSATLDFDIPPDVGDFSNKGTLILKKDNPSGIPAFDDALEIPVLFW